MQLAVQLHGLAEFHSHMHRLYIFEESTHVHGYSFAELHLAYKLFFECPKQSSFVGLRLPDELVALRYRSSMFQHL
jgi:hypothetical protein